jgi:hypothetical protein
MTAKPRRTKKKNVGKFYEKWNEEKKMLYK